MTWLLKLKHWQLFLLLMGSMFLGQFIMISMPWTWGVLVVMIIFGSLYFGWLWAIAFGACKKLPVELSDSPRVMGIGLIYAATYIVFSGLFFFGQGKMPGYGVVLHLLAMAAIFYALGFTAKQLTKLHQGKDTSFLDYSGAFFLFWFFPMGVWFIQPRVNKLFSEA